MKHRHKKKHQSLVSISSFSSGGQWDWISDLAKEVASTFLKKQVITSQNQKPIKHN
jgi:hypothetical protein